ncbi:MAG: cytochrome c biogenesis protein DipZ [Patescibacteria group bacterium]|nr:cytochrome c biogenesis protein DipZ [Patescibacteria group bacterium]
MFLLLTSFVAGMLTILAPCILPLLPVVVGGSLSGNNINKKKALIIVSSLGISVILFTFLLKASSLLIVIPAYTWVIISGGILLLFGIVTLFPAIWENRLLARANAKFNIILGKGNKENNFWGDVIVGASLGPVFSTCSPTYFIILATVLPAKPIIGTVYLLSYTIGLCLSLFVLAFVSQRIVTRLGIIADSRSTFKKVLGIIFIIIGIVILTGYDKKLESDIIGANFFDVTKIEQSLLEKNTTDSNSNMEKVLNTTDNKSPNVKNIKTKYLTIAQKEILYQRAPDLSSIDGYINTDGKPITLAELKGKVVLLDIWTYSCINCQRTIPYVNAWYQKYKDQGFEVIGIHTPEFSFEKIQANVEKAVENFGIKYPVVLDNNYATWKALGNQYWPRKYLVDMDGFIVYDHIGEGGYDTTEKEIQKALMERQSRLDINHNIQINISNPSNTISVDPSKVNSSEVYFGSARNEYLGNGNQTVNGEQTFTLPKDINLNNLYLNGTWSINPEYAENKNVASIIFKYSAKNVYFVAGSDAGVEVNIYKDNVFVKKIEIKDEKLYPLIQDTDYGNHTLRIDIPSSGLKAFTFTFG